MSLEKPCSKHGPAIARKREAVSMPTLRRVPVLLQVLRTRRDGKVAETESDDNGRTWKPVSTDKLLSPNAGLDVVTLQDGRVMLVHNYGTSGRHRLAISMSYNNGEDYETIAMLEDNGEEYRRKDECFDPDDPDETDAAEYSYPYVIQSEHDGMVHITYTYSYYGSGGSCSGRENIKHVIIDPCKLKGAEKAPLTCGEV